MKIEYDAEVDIMYIELRPAKIADTDEVAEGMVVDFDGSGQVVGIEILDASKLLGDIPKDVQFAVAGRSAS
jgi:uncharacterized protein YuzE